MTEQHTRAKGRSAEDRAVDYLIHQGFRIVSRNYQTRHGEIDCIAESPEGVLVFVEVKSSRGKAFGHPFFRVSRAKQRTIISMAKRYLADHRITNRPCRFDVVALVGESIDHLRNAFLA